MLSVKNKVRAWPVIALETKCVLVYTYFYKLLLQNSYISTSILESNGSGGEILEKKGRHSALKRSNLKNANLAAAKTCSSELNVPLPLRGSLKWAIISGNLAMFTTFVVLGQ